MTDSDSLRIGTAERESAVKLLSDHMSEGRLSLAEYEERMGVALEAVTRADLKALFKDLPPPYPHFMAPPPPMVTLPPPSTPPAFFPPAPPPELSGTSHRYQVVAGVLQLAFPFGIGRFYTGHIGIGLAQLLSAIVLVGVVWSWIDGIIMLANGGYDAEGRKLR